MATSRKGAARSAPRQKSPPINGTKQPRKKTKAKAAAVARPLLLTEQLANSYDLMNDAHRLISKVYLDLPDASRDTFDQLRRRFSIQLRLLTEVLDVADELLDDDDQADAAKGGAA